MADSAAADAAQDRPRRRLYTQLWFLVLVAIVAGIAFGLAFPGPAVDAKWLADAFIQLIQTITGPVIFITVVIGIASLGNIARAGGLALRALGYFLVMTVIALTLGLLAGNIVKPGSGFEGQPSEEGAGGRGGADRRGGRRSGARVLHHRQPAARELPRPVRRQRDPARPDPGDPDGDRDLVPGR